MMPTARYRVSSKQRTIDGVTGYIGRVHYYEPFKITWPGERHDSVYKTALYSEYTSIPRLTAKDAQDDAIMIGREATGRQPDNCTTS